MMATGWWHVKFECTLEGEVVYFDDLSEATQEHILRAIYDGFRWGEIVEENDDEEDEDEC